MASLTDQQRSAVETIDRDVLVAAGAGSGKTHVLVERFIELLEKLKGASVSDIVAVTFTRKAASEMRTRLKARMKELSTLGGEEDRQRWLTFAAEVDGARIGTIHSLCEMILKAFPVDAQIDPTIEVVDDLERAQLQEDSINQCLREVIADRSPSHEFLLRHPIEEIRKWLNSAISSQAQFTEALARIDFNDKAVWEREIVKLIDSAKEGAVMELTAKPAWQSALKQLQDNPFPDPESPLGRHQRAMIELAVSLSSAKAGSTPAWNLLGSMCEIKPGNVGGRNDQAKLVRDGIANLRNLADKCSKKLPDGLTASDEKAFESLRWFADLARRSLFIYKKHKLEKLKIDFDDLIELAVKTLVRENSSARKYYNQTIRAILVDEFQDTNRRQAELVSLMAGPQTKLFLIGDDKQSIYKFQGADVSTFNEWRDRFSGKDTAAILGLTQSFRSHPTVVSFVNALFAHLMNTQANDRAFKAKFERLTAARTDSHDVERVNLIWFDGKDQDGQKVAQESEAAAVAQWILEMVESKMPIKDKGAAEQNNQGNQTDQNNQSDQNNQNDSSRPISFGDFAVLVQRNRDFSHLERALAKASIPYVTLGGRGYLHSQEIYDFVNLLCFLSNPRDDHALLGILRSPIFSLSDDMLHRLGQARSSQPARSLWQCLKDTVACRGQGYEQYVSAANQLKIWLDDVDRLTVSELLSKVILTTCYDLILMPLPNGLKRSRNIWRLVWLAGEHEEMSASQFATTINLMRKYNVKQADAPLDSGNAVKLMTIHNSKGLEFPAVALPVLNARFHDMTRKLYFHRDYGVAINVERDPENKPASFAVSRYLDQEMETAEKKRLFYVAVTRARDYLALFAQSDGAKTESFAGWIKDLVPSQSSQSGQGQPGSEQAGQPAPSGQSAQPGQEDWIASLGGLLDQGGARFKARQTGVARLSGGKKESSDDAATACAIPMKLDLIDAVDRQEKIPTAAARRRFRLTPLDSNPLNIEASVKENIDQTVIGTLFHSLMEHLPFDLSRHKSEFVEALIFAQGDVAAHPAAFKFLKGQADQLLDVFFESDLAAKLMTARRRLHEVPYTAFLGDQERSRRPDMLFEDAQGDWHLVDFKTDHFDLSALSMQANLHLNQLAEYVSDLNKITNISFSAHIYFAQHGLLHKLETK